MGRVWNATSNPWNHLELLIVPLSKRGETEQLRVFRSGLILERDIIDNGFLLEQIETRANLRSRSRFGTGSGFSIRRQAWLTRRYRFDLIRSVRLAKENRDESVRSNLRQDLTRLPVRRPRAFNVVAVNLIDDLLIRSAERFLPLAADGTLCAGILRSSLPPQKAYEGPG